MILREFTIGKNDCGQRLDRFLTKQGLTVGVIRKALRNKDIKVNGTRRAADYKLLENDTVKIFIKEISKQNPPQAKIKDYTGCNSNVNIIYEDGNIIIADKPTGLLCHSGELHGISKKSESFENKDTLIERVKAYLYNKGEFRPENENSFEPSLCNRIDRNTGGIVIAAKNAETLRVMNEKIKLRQLTKLYLCILTSVPEKKEATLTAYLRKDAENNTVIISGKKADDNKTIVTKYRILAERNGLALAEVELVTGRTHQIRAHMAYIGCPLLGDGKYGRNKINKRYGFDKQALYSYKLIFNFIETPDIGINSLNYLNHKQFEVKDIWFLDKFYNM